MEKLAYSCLSDLQAKTRIVARRCAKTEPSLKEINDVAKLMRLVINASKEAMSENAFGDKIQHILSTSGNELTLSVNLRLVDLDVFNVSVSHTITSSQNPDSIHIEWADDRIKKELSSRGLKRTALSDGAPSLLVTIQDAQLDHSIYDYKGAEALADEVAASRRKILGMVASGVAAKRGNQVDYPNPRVGNIDKGTTRSWYFKAVSRGQTIFEISVTDHPKQDDQLERQQIREDVRFLYQNRALVVSSFPCPASMQLWTRNCGLLAV